MQGGGLADPCPHFLWGHTSSEGEQKIRGTGEPGAKAGGHMSGIRRTECCQRPRLVAKRTEPSSQHTGRSVISICSPLSTCCLRPSAQRFGAQRSLDPLQRRVD